MLQRTFITVTQEEQNSSTGKVSENLTKKCIVVHTTLYENGLTMIQKK